MILYASHVMTLANSIIGVSVLAMPFCFKQCGVILAVLVLVLCCLLSRLACHFLIKSAVMSRRRNYEFLAFHAFGPIGKFSVELFIIGFLIGTCIAFFVVIGDLGPQILGKILNKNSEDIRTSFLLTTGALVVLPLGLLRNIDSLASISTVTIGFYLCLVLKVIVESMGHIFRGDWYDNVNYWRPAGILQCLPIFSMALFCQTQLFEIYESIENVSLEKMNTVVRGAMNICTIVYVCVGFFGYVAFCTQFFSGNILMSFEPSLTSDAIKIGFVLSVVFSFPLVIFPCRASLNSLFFRRVYLHETASNYIPETRFRCLTFTIVTVSLIIGLLMPNIEFVLGLVGSTIGVMICLIFPAGFFITISTKNTNERLVAQVILFIGVWIMILGSYANLYAIEESSTTRVSIVTEKPFLLINNIHLNDVNDHPRMIAPVGDVFPKENANLLPDLNKLADKPLKLNEEVWHDSQIAVERPLVEKSPFEPQQQQQQPYPLSINATIQAEFKKLPKKIKMTNKLLKLDDKKLNKSLVKELQNQVQVIKEPAIPDNKEIYEKKPEIEIKNNAVQQVARDDSINIDAIKKEDTEIAAANVELSVKKIPDTVNDPNLDKKNVEQIVEVVSTNNKNNNINNNNINDDLEKSINNETHIKEKLNLNEINNSKNGNLEELNRNLDKNDKRIDGGELLINNNNKNENESGKRSFGLDVPLMNVPSLKSRGVVLNALTNWTSNNILGTDNNNKNDNNYNNNNVNNNIKNNTINIIKNINNSDVNNGKIDEKNKVNNNKQIHEGKEISNNENNINDKNNNINNSKIINSKNGDMINDNNNQLNNSDKKDNKNANNNNNNNIKHQYSLPIALQLINQSREKEDSSKANPQKNEENKNENNPPIVHRDILAEHNREKRDVEDEKVLSSINKKEDEIDNDNEISEHRKVLSVNIRSVNNEKLNCVRNESSELVIEKGGKIGSDKEENVQIELTSGVVTINETNVYLIDDVKLIDGINLNDKLTMNSEYQIVKKRDLKAVDLDRGDV